MDRTTLEPPARTPSLAKSEGESESDHRPIPADGNEHFPAIFSLARAYFEAQGLNHMDAQDLATEAGLRWLAQLRLGRPACRAWLRLVERHLLIDHFRRRGREQLLLESYAGELRSTAEENHRPKEWWAETLAELPPADRDLLPGHYAEGLKARELACRLELSADCVKQRLHRARQRRYARRCGGPARPTRPGERGADSQNMSKTGWGRLAQRIVFLMEKIGARPSRSVFSYPHCGRWSSGGNQI